MFSVLIVWQEIFISLEALCLVVGVKVVVELHYIRIGKPWYYGLKPFVFPFRHFSPSEWRNLLMLLFLSFSFFLIAMYAEPI